MAPFRSFRDALIDRYGEPTYKLTLMGGRTCPTRDGTFGPKKGWGGCTFCNPQGSASFYSHKNQSLPIKKQLEQAASAVQRRFGAKKFIAYFQNYTTTLQELKEFRLHYEAAVEFPHTVALAIATRPDCLPDEFLKVLMSYLDRVDVQLELGVQSFHDPTLEWYDRGHDSQSSISAIERAVYFQQKTRDKRGIFDIFVHLIFGTEPEQEIVRTAQLLNTLGITGVKIHNLHILKRTKLAHLYKKNPFPLPTVEEHLERVALFLRHLNPQTIILRTHGAANSEEDLIAPRWSNQRAYPSQRLRVLMKKRNWQQGDLIAHKPPRYLSP